MCTVAPAMIRFLRESSRAPLVLLALVCVLSLGARLALLGEPCQSPCNRAGEHTLIFDEAYYVNAARVIAGIRPPPGAHYAQAPLGTDPNAEHPQLAKLIMAGAIELFGDGPFAWRIGSLIFGTIAILGMFALIRAAGGGRWLALGAATLLAGDNLLLVHGRIGTLDIYAVAMMIWALVFYLRDQPVRAGLALAVGSACKLVAPYLLAVLVLLEIGRLLLRLRDRSWPARWALWPALRRFLICAVTGSVVFIAMLAVMDKIATPYNDAAGQLITGGAFAHFRHMVSYADNLVSPHGPQGIASYPWAWLIDLKPIVYLRVNPSLPGDGLYAIHPVSKFLGMISPPVLFMAMLGVVASVVRLVRVRPASGPIRAAREGAPALVHGLTADPLRTDRAQLPLVGLSWFLGTWLPFALLSLLDQRTSYLYYMVVVMPGLYVLAAWLSAGIWRVGKIWTSAIVIVWWLAVLAAVVVMYPFVPVF